MAKESSVAPKERVNIVYKPSTDGAQEDVELPLKMLVLGDFTGREDDRTLENRKPAPIDKDNFDETLKAHNISVHVNVPNKLAADEEQNLDVKLNIKSLKDFEPESIASQVPEIKQLLELREALRSLKGPLSNIPEFRKKIQTLIKDDTTRRKLLAEIGLEEA